MSEKSDPEKEHDQKFYAVNGKTPEQEGRDYVRSLRIAAVGTILLFIIIGLAVNY